MRTRKRNYAKNDAMRRHRCMFARHMRSHGATHQQIAALLNVERTTVTYYLSDRCKW